MRGLPTITPSNGFLRTTARRQLLRLLAPTLRSILRNCRPSNAPLLPTRGTPKLDQKYQKQQDKLIAKQNQDRQKLQQKQDKEHQQLARQNANPAKNAASGAATPATDAANAAKHTRSRCNRCSRDSSRLAEDLAAAGVADQRFALLRLVIEQLNKGLRTELSSGRDESAVRFR